jgi:Ca2+-binding EF-hand superfamily protein
MRSKLPFIFVATLCAGSAALAQSPGAPAGRQEHRNRLLSRFDEQFKAADKDRDGILTRAEAEAAGMGRIVRHFDRIDGNKDGKVTRDELRAVVRIGLSR